jgi:hypothetical protein
MIAKRWARLGLLQAVASCVAAPVAIIDSAVNFAWKCCVAAELLEISHGFREALH